jgi:anti-sigma regulatory factor (Ser/Thr protein kinase)/anti-anti-sigma regulatory factor
VATQTLELLIRLTGHRDDVTLLAAQLVPPEAGLALTVPATEEWLAEARKQLGDWLDALHVGKSDGDVLRHAVVELVTNVVDHAYLDSPDVDTVTIDGELTGTGHARIRVTDRGQWRAPSPSPDRGLGLHLTSKLVDELRVDHGAEGTTAIVSHRLTRPGRLLTGEDVTAGSFTRPPAQPAPLLVLDQPSAPRPRLRVDGPVDVATAEEFDAGVRAAGSAGGRSPTLDLAGVSHLASAGAAALHRLVALHRDNGTELRLYAPAGTAADMILTLVGLEHETADPDYPA